MSREVDEILKELDRLGRDAPEMPPLPDSDSDEDELQMEDAFERAVETATTPREDDGNGLRSWPQGGEAEATPQSHDSDPGSDLKELLRELIDVAERIPEEVNSLLRA